MANATMPEAFEIKFSPDLTPEQVATCLTILADYYRACGGAGFQPDFDLAEVLIAEPEGALV